jgi:hypothetical protein
MGELALICTLAVVLSVLMTLINGVMSWLDQLPDWTLTAALVVCLGALTWHDVSTHEHISNWVFGLDAVALFWLITRDT